MTVRGALAAAGDVPDAYVVSLYVSEEENDPRRPTVTVGFNTEAQVEGSTPSAWDAEEARWNYAFWLQNELVVVGDSDRDPDGAALREQWLRGVGHWYEDSDVDDLEDEPGITEDFVAMLVTLVQDLHSSGVVEQVFGRRIPVLIHELEYYDEISEQNREANPQGLVDDFARWVDGS